MAWHTCPLKAGHAGTASLIFHVLPNFIVLLDALTNTYLGLRKSKLSQLQKHRQNIFILISF